MSARLPTQQKVRYVDTVARDHLLVITASIKNLQHYTTNYSKDQYNHGFDKFYFFYFCTGILQFWLSLDIFMTFPQCKKLALRHYRHVDNGNSRQICSYVFRCLLTGACSGFSWCLFFCLFVCVFQRWRKSDWIFPTNDLFRFGRWNILCPLNHSINWSLILLVLKFKFLFCKRLRLVISWLKKQTNWTI